MIRLPLYALIALLLAAPWVAAADPPQAQALLSNADRLPNAALAAATFVAGESQQQVTFRTAGQERTVAWNQLVRWGHPREVPRAMVLFADGSRVTVTESQRRIHVIDEELKVDYYLFGEQSIPLESLRGVIVEMPADAMARDRLITWVESGSKNLVTAKVDRILLENGDEVTGTITTWSEEELELDTGQQQLPIKTSGIVAVALNPALTKKFPVEQARIAVGLQDGSVIIASEFRAAKARTTIKLVDGIEFSMSLSRVCFLQPLLDSTLYLSDLEPASYRHVPFLDRKWDYHRDGNVLGGTFRAGGNPYIKGIGMHSPARLTYRLDRKFTRFQAELAIDQLTGRRGSVVCKVFVDDGSGKWVQAYASEVIRGGEVPLSIDIDVRQARQMTLLVDYADRGDQLDHLNWLDARLVPHDEN